MQVGLTIVLDHRLRPRPLHRGHRAARLPRRQSPVEPVPARRPRRCPRQGSPSPAGRHCPDRLKTNQRLKAEGRTTGCQATYGLSAALCPSDWVFEAFASPEDLSFDCRGQGTLEADAVRSSLTYSSCSPVAIRSARLRTEVGSCPNYRRFVLRFGSSPAGSPWWNPAGLADDIAKQSRRRLACPIAGHRCLSDWVRQTTLSKRSPTT